MCQTPYTQTTRITCSSMSMNKHWIRSHTFCSSDIMRWKQFDIEISTLNWNFVRVSYSVTSSGLMATMETIGACLHEKHQLFNEIGAIVGPTGPLMFYSMQIDERFNIWVACVFLVFPVRQFGAKYSFFFKFNRILFFSIQRVKCTVKIPSIRIKCTVSAKMFRLSCIYHRKVRKMLRKIACVVASSENNVEYLTQTVPSVTIVFIDIFSLFTRNQMFFYGQNARSPNDNDYVGPSTSFQEKYRKCTTTGFSHRQTETKCQKKQPFTSRFDGFDLEINL